MSCQLALKGLKWMTHMAPAHQSHETFFRLLAKPTSCMCWGVGSIFLQLCPRPLMQEHGHLVLIVLRDTEGSSYLANAQRNSTDHVKKFLAFALQIAVQMVCFSCDVCLSRCRQCRILFANPPSPVAPGSSPWHQTCQSPACPMKSVPITTLYSVEYCLPIHLTCSRISFSSIAQQTCRA